MSVILVGTAAIKIFLKSNKLLVLLLVVEYGMSLYGFAFAIVAFFPSKKSSATFASLVHILSYYFGIAYQGYSTGTMAKLVTSLVPNASLCFMVEHLMQCEYLGSGLSFDQASMPVKNYTFNQGLVMLAIDIALYAFLGYYFDQVIPTKDGVGVKKPWNFICKRLVRGSSS